MKSPARLHPLLSELVEDPDSATGSQPVLPEACRNCELASALPAVAVRSALREPSRLPLRSPVSRISRGAARFPGRSNKLRFPVACPNPWSPRRSPKFVFRLPGVPGFPEPPEIRRASCSAGYPMLREPRSRCSWIPVARHLRTPSEVSEEPVTQRFLHLSPDSLSAPVSQSFLGIGPECHAFPVSRKLITPGSNSSEGCVLLSSRGRSLFR